MRILIVSFIIVFVDQVSKFLVKGFSIPFLSIKYEGMFLGQRIPVIDDFFRITFIENPGMAFGFDPGNEMKLWISLFSLFASIGLFIYFYLIRYQSLSLRLAIAFILGGAIGNLIDRMLYGVLYGYGPLFYGKVVDFLDFDFFNVSFLGRNYDRWPIFNIADAAVSIGVLILIIFYKKHQKEPEETQTEQLNLQVEGTTVNQIAVNTNDENITGNPGRENSNDEPHKGKEIQD